MSITTNDDWTWVGSEYRTMFATTNDPRVVAVIERDDDASISQNMDGDAILAIYGIEYRGEYRADHRGGFRDDSFAQRATRARGEFRYAAGYRYNGLSYAMIAKGQQMLERWARIFHGAVLEFFDHGSDTWLVFSNDTYREHVGQEEFDIGQESRAVEAAASEVRSVLDGEVFGIGFATNESRRLEDGDPIDLDDPNWVTAIECWGFVGEDYAKESAAHFHAGEPDMDPMLELPTFTEPDRREDWE